MGHEVLRYSIAAFSVVMVVSGESGDVLVRVLPRLAQRRPNLPPHTSKEAHRTFDLLNPLKMAKFSST